MKPAMSLKKLFVSGLFVVSCIRMSIDAVCNIPLRNDLEKKCETTYDTIIEVAQDIQNDEDRERAHCCALDDMESCNLQAYDIAHCKDEKSVLRENLKAARLFLVVFSNVTCNEFKTQCSSSSLVFLQPWCLVFAALSFLAPRL